MKKQTKIIGIAAISTLLAVSVFWFFWLTEEEQRLNTIAQNIEIQRELHDKNDVLRVDIQWYKDQIRKYKEILVSRELELSAAEFKLSNNSREWQIRQDIINQNEARVDELSGVLMKGE